MPNMFAAQSSSSGGVMMFLPIVLLGVVFMLMIVGQRRRSAATAQAQGALTVGDEVRTTSGLYGRLTELDETTGHLEIASGVVVRFDRRALLPAEGATR